MPPVVASWLLWQLIAPRTTEPQPQLKLAKEEERDWRLRKLDEVLGMVTGIGLAAAACYPVLPRGTKKMLPAHRFFITARIIGDRQPKLVSLSMCLASSSHLLRGSLAGWRHQRHQRQQGSLCVCDKLCVCVCGGLTSGGSSSNSSCGSCGQFTLCRRVAGQDTLSIEVQLMP